jgi:hypothetical protein
MGTALQPAKAPPGPWEALGGIDVFGSYLGTHIHANAALGGFMVRRPELGLEVDERRRGQCGIRQANSATDWLQVDPDSRAHTGTQQPRPRRLP